MGIVIMLHILVPLSYTFSNRGDAWSLHFFEIIHLALRFHGNLILFHCRRHLRYYWPLHFHNLFEGSGNAVYFSFHLKK